MIGIWSRTRGTPPAVALRWLFSFERVSLSGEWSLRFFKRCVGYFRQIDNPSMTPVARSFRKLPGIYLPETILTLLSYQGVENTVRYFRHRPSPPPGRSAKLTLSCSSELTR